MKMYWLVIILNFLIKLRFPTQHPISEIITKRYGRDTWLKVRKWEDHLKKWEKAKLDVIFLERCLLYNVTPKFVKFKLHRRILHRRQFYKVWQRTLIINELQAKRKYVEICKSKLMTCYDIVKCITFFYRF